jgi:DNA (cytosine-5)-methyltransferase 1
MRYGSVCSGIEAASVAWEPLSWQAQWFAEIEHFPSAVLAHRFPTVPNLGDMTQIHNTETFNGNSIDLLVGGTPCQSFSVAGLRKGLDDPRGQLMYTFVELAARKRPKWVVWENVPGVLSSNGGDDFGSFLGLLTGRKIQSPRRGWKSSGTIPGIGSAYGVAWRILDAQYFGVAQRRRRVFVVGYLGDWRPAAAVLFERNSLSGHPPKGREKRKTTSSDAQGGSGGGGFVPPISNALCARDYKGARPEADQGAPLIAQPIPFRKTKQAQTKEDHETWVEDEKANTLNTFDVGDVRTTQAVVQPIAVDVYNQTINGHTFATVTADVGGPTHSGPKVMQPIAVDVYNQSIDGQVSATVTEAVGGSNTSGPKVMHSIDFRNNRYNEEQIAGTLQSKESGGYSLNYTTGVHQPPMAIRRLTPKECERLQGFPDGWTLIPYRGKPADQCPDGPRYKACGNSMAVPVMRWIGERIQMVEDLMKTHPTPKNS